MTLPPRLTVQLDKHDFENMQTCLQLGQMDSMAEVVRVALELYALRLLREEEERKT